MRFLDGPVRLFEIKNIIAHFAKIFQNTSARAELWQHRKLCANLLPMQKYKEDFIKFLVKTGALKFGEFKLKSGRVGPYFLNIGQFSTGEAIGELGHYYAQAIDEKIKNFDVVFGPAYKGIHLAVATVIAFNEKLGKNVSYAYNRKEVKDHGEGGMLIGASINKDTKIVIVDDVITAGTALRLVMDVLKGVGSPKVEGVVLAVDRMEKGQGEKSAIQELKDDFGIDVYSIVNIDEVVEYLYNRPLEGVVYIDDEKLAKIKAYREQYGV